MQAPFPIITPGIFLNEALRIGKARDNVNKIDTPTLDIPLSFRFIPFKPHIDVQKINWKFRTSFHEYTGVSLQAH
jgi:hypothetical protein